MLLGIKLKMVHNLLLFLNLSPGWEGHKIENGNMYVNISAQHGLLRYILSF